MVLTLRPRLHAPLPRSNGGWTMRKANHLVEGFRDRSTTQVVHSRIKAAVSIIVLIGGVPSGSAKPRQTTGAFNFGEAALQRCIKARQKQ